MNQPRSAPALWLLVCAACAGGGSAQRGQKTVGHVTIVGNHAASDKSITSKLATRPPHGLIFKKREAYDPVTVALDRQRIVAFYREHGYFSAQVTDVNVKNAAGGAVDVTFTVEEGKPTQVAAVDLQGMPSVDGKRLRTLLAPVRQGKTFIHPDYLLVKEALETELKSHGYAHADVTGTVEVNRDTRRAVVRLHVDAGPLVHFGDVHVEGLKRIPESAVLARVAWHQGDVFDPVKLDTTSGRLYALGAFGVVRIDYDKEGRPPVSDVTVHVTEGTRHEVRFGFGVGFERVRNEVRGRAAYMVHGFLDPLATLRLDARPGYSVSGAGGVTGFTGEASATLEKEDFLLPRMHEMNVVAYDYTPYDGYTLLGPRLQIGLDRPVLSDHLRWHLGWTWRDLTFQQVDPAVVASGSELSPYHLGYFDETLSYDARDRPLDARRGWFAQVALEEGGSYAGGAFDYAKVTPELRGYVSLGSRLVLAARARGGRLLGATGMDSPITQRYYGGGASGHRGFGYRRLSPMVHGANDTLIPIGGAELLESSLETRYDTVKIRGQWLGTVLFVDAGDVTAAGEMDVTHLHWAAGLGLRYDTIVGPLRVDLGIRLNRTGPEDPDPNHAWALHFSLGEAF